MATDGCITNGRVVLDLHKRDKETLEKYIEHIAAPINLNKQKSKQFGTENQLRAEFTNKETVDYLTNLGITPRKSKTLKINFPITWEFVRGVIDGDGSVSLINKNTGIKISIATASIEFYKQLQEFFDREGIKFTVSNNNKLFQIFIQTKESVLKCYYNLYNGDGVFMKRKQQKYGSVIQK